MFNSNLILSIEPVHHLNILLMLGIAVFGGTIGANLFQRLKIPQVVGYIVIGVIVGGSVLNLIDSKTVESLTPFNIFALGIIGFMIGGELKFDIFRKYGKQFLLILLAEGICAFIVVTLLVTFIASFFLQSWSSSLALGLLLGAISSATAPAATVDVLWEYKSRGILTRTILAIVALDDGLALLLYGIAGSFAAVLLGNGHDSLFLTVLEPIWDIVGAILLGIVIGAVLVAVYKYVKESEKLLTLTIASVMLTIGLAIVLKVESILAAMILGATLTNLLPRRSQKAFSIVKQFSPPIYVLFFVFVGARLELFNAPMWILLLAVTYVFGRTLGKITGSWFGAFISKSPVVVRKYLGICLFSQAGVAVGLSILASQKFSESIGEAIILIVTVTTFLVQIIGPPMVKLGIKKAGEIGLNVTEDDLIETYTVRDVMDEQMPVFRIGLSLGQVINVVSDTDSFYYPVIDDNRILSGSITLDGIRNTFKAQEVHDWLVAMDIMSPVIAVLKPATPLSEAFEQAKKNGVEYLPVIDSDQTNKFVGLLDCASVRRKLTAEVLSRQQKADNIPIIQAE